MKNYFSGAISSPYHLSVGAVVFNDEGLIACHHFEKLPRAENLEDIYLLMRETVEPGEALEETLARGLQEEFGATAEVVGFVGPLLSSFEVSGVEISKTTLYFAMKLKSLDPAKRDRSDPEYGSSVEWRSPEFLIDAMRSQAGKYNLLDIDESEVIGRAASMFKR